ncbi:MAG: DnaJ domain-containing protein [Alphaproteobacteria bacterium]|nr:DnaJ domain-containing protein [Alphaproteobacteria bacterium]
MFISWYKRAPKSTQKTVAKKVLIVGGVGLLLVLLLTGRLNPVFALIAAAVPLAYRALSLLQVIAGLKNIKNAFKAAGGPAPGQQSDVETRFFKMTLNHDSGEMNGEVLEGEFKGRRLSDLELTDLIKLLSECRRADAQSAAVLEAFLDRSFGDEWREKAGEDVGASGERPPPDKMTPEEARRILGVDEKATHEQIIEAHRRLMQKLHPDRGGSTYLAAQINAAKKILLDS